MGAPVWILSVDLQTKTATFQSGMADAARSARGAFTQIGSGAGEMSGTVGRTTGSARQAVMLLGDEFGIHLPRGLTTFISSLGPVGAAMEAAFPFVAILLGATLLLEHLAKLRAEGVKLTEDQEKFKTAALNAFNSMDDKILEAGRRVDELRGDHVGALKKELELIDHQSMAELVKEFDVLAKAADAAFADIHSHWYTFGAGAEGAKHSLESFQAEYAALLAKHDQAGASSALQEKLARELDIMQQQAKFKDSGEKMGTGSDAAWAASMEHERAKAALKQYGVGVTDSEIAAQRVLVDALKDQVTIEQQAADLKKLNVTAAKVGEGKKEDKSAAEKAKELVEFTQKGVDEEARIIREANEKMGVEIAQGEREKIDATKEGSAARLAAIDSALRTEQADGMEGLASYRELLTARVNLARQLSEEDKQIDLEAKRLASTQDEKMGELRLAAEREQYALSNSAHRANADKRLAQEVELANAETALQMTAVSQQIDALDKGGRDYENKLKELQNRQLQMTREHENAINAIKEKAEIDRNTRILSADTRFQDSLANGLTQSIMGHQSWAKTLNSIGNEVVTGMLQNAIKSALMDDFTKEKDAASAARKAFNIGLSIGGPAGMVLGPVFGAAAFASVMAFEGGGVVPGVGRGDIVPAMLEPGEGVLPKQLMDRLNTSSGSSSVTHLHAHVSPTYHLQALDTSGMSDILEKHSDVLTAHVNTTLRKMNR